MRLAAALALTAALLPAAALAQAWPRVIPAPGGEVIIPSAAWLESYETYNYAPARRAGDTLYVSGVPIGPVGEEGVDEAAFEAQVRRGFRTLDQVLKASGASFDDVVMINSFHVWAGPDVGVDRLTQIAIINKVKAEYIKGPHPAWSAVGTSGLLAPRAVVEIQLIVHAPKG